MLITLTIKNMAFRDLWWRSSSARETAMAVAAGAIAEREILKQQFCIQIHKASYLNSAQSKTCPLKMKPSL